MLGPRLAMYLEYPLLVLFFLDFCVEEAGLENHSEVQVVPVSEADGDFTGDQRIRHLQNGSP